MEIGAWLQRRTTCISSLSCSADSTCRLQELYPVRVCATLKGRTHWNTELYSQHNGKGSLITAWGLCRMVWIHYSWCRQITAKHTCSHHHTRTHTHIELTSHTLSTTCVIHALGTHYTLNSYATAMHAYRVSLMCSEGHRPHLQATDGRVREWYPSLTR